MLLIKRGVGILLILSLFLGCELKSKMWEPDGDVVQRNKKGKVTARIPAKRAAKEQRCFFWEEIRTMGAYIKELEKNGSSQ